MDHGTFRKIFPLVLSFWKLETPPGRQSYITCDNSHLQPDSFPKYFARDGLNVDKTLM